MDRGKLLVAFELVVAGAIFVGANFLDVVPVSETPWILALGWISLWADAAGAGPDLDAGGLR